MRLAHRGGQRATVGVTVSRPLPQRKGPWGQALFLGTLGSGVVFCFFPKGPKEGKKGRHRYRPFEKGRSLEGSCIRVAGCPTAPTRRGQHRRLPSSRPTALDFQRYIFSLPPPSTDQEQFAFQPVVDELSVRKHVPTYQSQDTGVGGNDGSGFNLDPGSSSRRNHRPAERETHIVEVNPPSGGGGTGSADQGRPRRRRGDRGQGIGVDRSPVRSGVNERAYGLGRRDRPPLSDQRMGQCASQPDSEVDDGSIGSDRDADQCHQMSALGMWSTGSDGETCFTKSGPIPNRE